MKSIITDVRSTLRAIRALNNGGYTDLVHCTLHGVTMEILLNAIEDGVACSLSAECVSVTMSIVDKDISDAESFEIDLKNIGKSERDSTKGYLDSCFYRRQGGLRIRKEFSSGFSSGHYDTGQERRNLAKRLL